MAIPYTTQRLKYVFIDVVGFTADYRDVEDLFAIIQAMNSIVKECLACKLPQSSAIHYWR